MRLTAARTLLVAAATASLSTWYRVIRARLGAGGVPDGASRGIRGGIGLGRLGVEERQADPERRAAPWSLYHFDVPVVIGHDPRDDRPAEPASPRVTGARGVG